MKARVLHGIRVLLNAVKVVVVALVCLLIGFSARQLFDTYAMEKIPFLRQADPETELHLSGTPPPSFSTQALFD